MASDLENSLVNGGISPAAAKIISNAIANLATGRTNIGRQLADATPADRMRLIDSNTRRYVLTNLDYPAKSPPAERGVRRGRKHPYEDSQPASANPTIATPSVTGGKFMSVATGADNSVAQSEVTLRQADKGGPHARLNASTGEVEAVPFSIEFEPKGLLEGSVVEESGRTVIRIKIVNTALRSLLRKKLGVFTSITSAAGPCTLRVDDEIVGEGAAFVLLPEQG